MKGGMLCVHRAGSRRKLYSNIDIGIAMSYMEGDKSHSVLLFSQMRLLVLHLLCGVVVIATQT